jgi:primosomal protein N' (replication factor Y)
VVNTPLHRRVAVTEDLASEEGASPLSSTFHYAIPPELQNQARVGQLVWVPFGPRRLQGLILALSDTSPVKETKELYEIIPFDPSVRLRAGLAQGRDPQPVLSPAQIQLARWISGYYLAPLIDCVRLMLPPGIEQRAETVVELRADAPSQRNLTRQQQTILELLRRSGPQKLSQIGRQLKDVGQVGNLSTENVRPVIDQLVRRGLVATRSEISKPQVRPRQARFVCLIADEAQIEQALPHLGRPSKQADVLLALAESEDPLPTLREVCAAARCSKSTIQALAEKGLVEITEGRQMVASLLSPQAINEAMASDLSRAPKQAAALAYLRDAGEPVDVKEMYRQVGCSSAVLNQLEAKGCVERLSQEPAVILAIPLEKVAEAVIELRRAHKQVAVLEFLKGEEGPVWIGWVYAQTGCNLRILRDLEKHGLVSLEEEEVRRDPLEGREFVADVPPRLTPDQEAVWKEIARGMKARVGQVSIPAVEQVSTPAAGQVSIPAAEQVSLPAYMDASPLVYLLHGVTGSGKTEIYLRALQATLAMGRGAIVLVPEIALTPQTIRRFAARFPGRITVLHSKLSLGERYDTWRRIRAGEVDVVIGSRSAVFAPLPHLGLIVMDEEHEWSYKQEKTPRYHTREVALKLAELAGAMVILGSATPDVVSYYKAQRGEYKLLELPQRIMGHRTTDLTPWPPSLRGKGETSPPRVGERPGEGSPPQRGEGPGEGSSTTQELGPEYQGAYYLELPPVQIVDLRQELYAGNRSIFSRALQQAMTEALAAGQQVILFLNRRGTATFVMCRDCGHVLKCPRCDVPLTYHGARDELICHHCNRRSAVPPVCPHCWSRRIKFFGLGTQKVEAVTGELFPQARLLRWDRDATGGKDAHDIFLERFIKHEADVMIGTQMVAKGLDLPLVTLVGVINADTALYLPDFRAGERTFQILTQVAGRAGRSVLGGQVIVQTYTPEHYCIQAASRHDYEGFYRQEVAFRREQGYPPFRRLAQLVYTHSNAARCEEEANKLDRLLRDKVARLGLPAVDLIGPAPCFRQRLRGKYRWQIVVRAADPRTLLADMAFPLGWRVDMDPVSLL